MTTERIRQGILEWYLLYESVNAEYQPECLQFFCHSGPQQSQGEAEGESLLTARCALLLRKNTGA